MSRPAPPPYLGHVLESLGRSPTPHARPEGTLAVTPRGSGDNGLYNDQFLPPPLTHRTEEFVSCTRGGPRDEDDATPTASFRKPTVSATTYVGQHYSGPDRYGEDTLTPSGPYTCTVPKASSADTTYNQDRRADRWGRSGFPTRTMAPLPSTAPPPLESKSQRRADSSIRSTSQVRGSQIPSGSRHRTNSSAASLRRQNTDDRSSGREAASGPRHTGTSTRRFQSQGPSPIRRADAGPPKRPSVERSRPTLPRGDSDRPPLYGSVVRGGGESAVSIARSTASRTNRGGPPSSLNRGRAYLDTAGRGGVEFEGFEDVTVDPSKYSREEVRRAAAAAVIRYLEMKHYTEVIAVRQLANCQSMALYTHILDFMFAQLGPLPFYDHLKFEERVPRLYKDLGYPGTLAKSHMRSPCTLSTWPQHLVAMAWLAGLLSLDDKVLRDLRVPESSPEKGGGTSESTPCPAARTPRAIGGGFRYTECFPPRSGGGTGMYLDSLPRTTPHARYFTDNGEFAAELGMSRVAAEDASPTAAAVRAVQTSYLVYRKNEGCVDRESLNRIIEGAVRRLRARIDVQKQEAATAYENASKEYNCHADVIKEIKRKEASVARLQTDIEKMRGAIATSEMTHRQQLDNIASLSSLCDAKDAQATCLKKEVDACRERVQTQEISREEVEPIIQKTAAQKKRFEDKRKEKAELDNEIRLLEAEVTRLEDTIRATARRITQRLHALRSASAPGTPGRPLSSRRQNNPLPRPIQLDLGILTGPELVELASSRFQAAADVKGLDRPSLAESDTSVTWDDTIVVEEPWTGPREFITKVEDLMGRLMGGESWAAWLDQMRAALDAETTELSQCKTKLASLRRAYEANDRERKRKVQTCKALQENIEDTLHDLSTQKKRAKDLVVQQRRAEEDAQMNMRTEDHEDEEELRSLESKVNEMITERDAKLKANRERVDAHLQELNTWKQEVLSRMTTVQQAISSAATQVSTNTMALRKLQATLPTELLPSSQAVEAAVLPGLLLQTDVHSQREYGINKVTDLEDQTTEFVAAIKR